MTEDHQIESGYTYTRGGGTTYDFMVDKSNSSVDSEQECPPELPPR